MLSLLYRSMLLRRFPKLREARARIKAAASTVVVQSTAVGRVCSDVAATTHACAVRASASECERSAVQPMVGGGPALAASPARVSGRELGNYNAARGAGARLSASGSCPGRGQRRVAGRRRGRASGRRQASSVNNRQASTVNRQPSTGNGTTWVREVWRSAASPASRPLRRGCISACCGVVEAATGNKD